MPVLFHSLGGAMAMADGGGVIYNSQQAPIGPALQAPMGPRQGPTPVFGAFQYGELTSAGASLVLWGS